MSATPSSDTTSGYDVSVRPEPGPDRFITGDSKTQLVSDALHAFVVLIVVVCVTYLASANVGLPQDVIGTVYGGAIGYAAGRAGSIGARRPIITQRQTNGNVIP